MALVNKNQMAGNRGATRNEWCNGGGEVKTIKNADGTTTEIISNMCLRKHNAANCGSMWKTKCRRQLSFGIKSKKRGGY